MINFLFFFDIIGILYLNDKKTEKIITDKLNMILSSTLKESLEKLKDSVTKITNIDKTIYKNSGVQPDNLTAPICRDNFLSAKSEFEREKNRIIAEYNDKKIKNKNNTILMKDGEIAIFKVYITFLKENNLGNDIFDQNNLKMFILLNKKF